MAYAIQSGIQISLNGTTWYQLTDHNRSSISIKPELIEKSTRMADGSTRKYVVSKKDSISTSWNMVPSKTESTVDGHYSSAWIEAFYYANAGVPVYLKVVEAVETVPSLGSYPTESGASATTASKTYQTFITSFDKTIVGRTPNGDMVNFSLEFKEI